jgi:hypothetical protein
LIQISLKINFFAADQMKKLVEAELILETNPKNCSSLMKRAISIAACCYTYQNFNGVAEILSALLSPKLVSEEKSKAWEVIFFYFFLFFN